MERTSVLDISKALPIKGYMSEQELTWLATIATRSKCIVEIGTFYGRSARALADNTNGRLYCIDPYPGIVFQEAGVFISSGSYVFRQAQKNLEEHVRTGKVHFHRGTVETFPHNIKPDFIFIDGNHHEEFVSKDIDWALKMCNDGVISGHDYDDKGWPDVKKVVDQYFPNIGREGSIWYVNR